jgi:hypothetical protein
VMPSDDRSCWIWGDLELAACFIVQLLRLHINDSEPAQMPLKLHSILMWWGQHMA